MTDRTEALDIEAIERRVEQATPGPWDWSASGANGRTYVRAPDSYAVAETTKQHDASANAEFIAHAHSDIPALIEALRASNEERERVRALVEKWRNDAAHSPDWNSGDEPRDVLVAVQACADELEAALSHPISPEEPAK